MQGILNWLGNNIQIVIFLGFIALSVFGSIAKQLAEKKAERKIAMDRRRREMDALRTGGSVDDLDEPQDTSEAAQRQQRLAELAERRRQQLEELRKRRASAGTSAPPVPSAPPRSIPVPTPRPTPRPAPGAPTARPTPRPVPTARPTPPRPMPGPSSIPSPQPATQRRRSGKPEPSRREMPAPSAAITEGAIGSSGNDRQTKSHPLGVLKGMNNFELRRAIVLSEVLAPPVSERTGDR